MYIEGISNSDIVLPQILDSTKPVWHIFAIRCNKRDELAKYLEESGIGVNKHYPIPIHLQKGYSSLGYHKGAFPLAELISSTELSLPMYYGMTDEQVNYVIQVCNCFSIDLFQIIVGG